MDLAYFGSSLKGRCPLRRFRSIHLSHAVDSDHSDLVIEIVLVNVALVEHDLEKQSQLINVHAFELPRLKIRALVAV